MKNQKEIKKAYQDILAVCEKYSYLRDRDGAFGDIEEMVSGCVTAPGIGRRLLGHRCGCLCG